jgi:hypothetical protein
VFQHQAKLCSRPRRFQLPDIGVQDLNQVLVMADRCGASNPRFGPIAGKLKITDRLGNKPTSREMGREEIESALAASVFKCLANPSMEHHPSCGSGV